MLLLLWPYIMSSEVRVSFYFFPQKAASKTGKEKLKDLSMEEEKQNCACQCHFTLINIPTVTQNDADMHTWLPLSQVHPELCRALVSSLLWRLYWTHCAHGLKNIILNTRQQDTFWC